MGAEGEGQGKGDRAGQDDADSPLTSREEANLEVDVQSLFSIGDTHHLALLIDDRDEILENLEIAETRYIASFRLSTPDPSIADFELPPIVENSDRPYISHPRALAGATTTRRRRRRQNPAYAASSLAPTSFVAPSQYYKLRGVQGVSGGRFADPNSPSSLSDSIHQRVVGTRFQEVNRNSEIYGRLPLGSHVKLEKSGELGPSETHLRTLFNVVQITIKDHGSKVPNLDSWILSRGTPSLPMWMHRRVLANWTTNGWILCEKPQLISRRITMGRHLLHSPQAASNYDEMGVVRRRQPKIFQTRRATEDSARRETFPLRLRGPDPASGDSPLVPPHLRLQQQQPFVRPVSGLNHNDLGSVYGDISQWRSKLKAINAEIEEAQRNGYNDIALGANIKGWLMVGRGLRFIPGAQLIEGRAKEDVRWDVLQNERSTLDSVVVWTIIVIVIVLLAAGSMCIHC
jgi:hypothetical protein